MSDISSTSTKNLYSYIPNIPMVLWMVLITIGLGLAGGLPAQELISTVNAGFGRALGEFALILLPAFVLAAALSKQEATPATGMAAAVSPIAGAGMICPDTAYAVLSPIAGRQKLDVAFGSYAGFKLLYPAGPLIVATGLGVEDTSLALYGLALLIPVWLAGVVWVRSVGAMSVNANLSQRQRFNLQSLRPLAPFAVLVGLLIIGALFDLSSTPFLYFMTLPKGALITAATLALLDVPSTDRRSCLDSSVRRTGSLLLVIGAASAFGVMLTHLVPLGEVFPSDAGIIGILSLFALTALFKLAQGSSMATFAAIAPVAAPIVASSGMSPVAAVFAICLGSFVAIMPNDSFYWLTRRDALENTESEGRAIGILAGGAIAQALTGLSLVLGAVSMGLI